MASSTQPQEEHSTRTGMMVKIGGLVAVITAAIVLARRYDLQQQFRNALAWMQNIGPTGWAVFFALYVFATVLMLPGTILTLGAGAVFGVVKGSILVSLSSTAGATAAFLVGRYLARDAVARRVSGRPLFRAIDEAVAQGGWKIVGLTRLSPVFPFNLLNYAFGLTRVPLREYVVASWIGMLPGTIMYVYVGSLAGSLAELGAGGRRRSPAEWILYIVGLLATVAVTVVVTRAARRALRKTLPATPETVAAEID